MPNVEIRRVTSFSIVFGLTTGRRNITTGNKRAGGGERVVLRSKFYFECRISNAECRITKGDFIFNCVRETIKIVTTPDVGFKNKTTKETFWVVVEPETDL